MIVGIGNDIIEISRIEKACRRSGFIERYFTARERALFSERKGNMQTIAGNFAAKEAIAKMLGTGFRKMALTDVEILRDDLGKPVAELNGHAKELAGDKGIDRIHVSIAHSSDYATAFAIGEMS